MSIQTDFWWNRTAKCPKLGPPICLLNKFAMPT
jgi:hypothetical protein